MLTTTDKIKHPFLGVNHEEKVFWEQTLLLQLSLSLEIPKEVASDESHSHS
ncbi:hypothetical protein NIES23_35930 [Trichormus variabilis NIES-23]|uniref:Uncharacterized protein n=1 Tax=Trichormus variabilis NIES-23 TaxID=1973479 RepID=A0A1Z4KP60_ANAVA|nr:asr5187 [Nostoc sp. PCC 7120 = FACHB-418]BAY70785.1 hypothetical protein NIES23_35930 [Trichormus variabilis NIES-23]